VKNVLFCFEVLDAIFLGFAASLVAVGRPSWTPRDTFFLQFVMKKCDVLFHL
jgi:hypothetical protein